MLLLLSALALAGPHGPPLPPGGDFDSDGLSNAAERALGTRLGGADTDGDGWTDGEEVSWGSDPLDAGQGPDDDDDGLVIVQEVDAGTDPTVADTDGDGFVDGVEVVYGTDPLDAAVYP